MKNSILLLMFLLVFTGVKAQNQTVYLSRVFSDQEINNPAYTAYRQNVGFKLLYSSHFGSLKGQSKFYGAHVSFPIVKSEIGSSINVINEEIGLRQLLKINACVNNCVKISSFSYLSGGISIGILNQAYRESSIITDPDVDLTKLDLNKTSLNVGAGVYYFDPYIFAGVAMNDLAVFDKRNIPNIDFYFGCNYSPSPYKYVLKSCLLYKYFNEDHIFQLNEKIYYNDIIGFGANYSFSYEWGLNFDIKIKDSLWLSYSYENHINTNYIGLQSYNICLYYSPKYEKRIFSSVKRFKNLYNYR